MLRLPHQIDSPSDPDVLASIDIEEPEDFAAGAQADEAGDVPGGDSAASPGTLSRDQFREGLAAALGLAGTLTALETLKSAPAQPTFPPAADAIYDSAEEIPWLRFLIEPGNVWLGRAIAIGAFTVPLAVGCKQEIAARNAAPISQPEAEEQSRQAPTETAEVCD